MDLIDEDEATEPACEALASEENDPAVQNLGRKYAAIVACEIIRWILCEGKASPERIRKNAHIAAWCMIPELQNTTQVELALAMGLRTKQDLDRSIRSFCEQFGFVRATQHGAQARIQERMRKHLRKQARQLQDLAVEAQYEI